jgi:glutamyl-tRNA synthetase
MDDLIAHFDLERVNKSPAVFSYEKLDWFNGVYLRSKKTDELYDLILPFMIEGNLFKKEEIAQYKEYILQIIPLIQERLTSLKEVVDRTWFFFDRFFTIKEKDTLIPKKGTPKDAIKILERTIEVLSPLSSFHEDELEKAFRVLVDDLGMKTGAVFMTVRVAITGTCVSPGLFETMNVMGKDRVIQRLREAKELVKNMT